MTKYGIIGYPLGHSFSKGFFTEKFARESIDAQYLNFEIPDVAMLPDVLRNNPELRGLNVTLPHKQSVIPLLDEMSKEAKEIGAVNVIRVRNGKLKGFNTDVVGFKAITSQLSVISKRGAALILGSGGASKAVQYVLRKENIQFRIASRNAIKLGIIRYDEINTIGFAPYSIIINTTPVGMFPNVDKCLELPYSTIEPRHTFIDLIYNPEETLFLKKARLKGATTFNGMTMLHEQAEAAWEIWRLKSEKIM